MSLKPDWRLALALVVLVLAGCGGDDVEPDSTIPPGEGASSPLAAVEELVEAINAPDFVEASRLAVPEHAALASLAEGATFADVAGALRNGDQEIAANFWAGFAQGTANFLAGEVTVVDNGTLSKGDLEFHDIAVTPPSGGTRSILVRDAEGYRIDLFASFGSGLADKMTDPVQRLLTAQTDDARLILASLQGIVPSLLTAAELPGTPGDVSQQILALVEVITRVG
jgi:hypothetical protein